MPALSDYNYIDSYRSAERALDGNSSKVIGNNTKVYRTGDSISISLHGNKIISFYASGYLKLYDQGYQTSTTKDRMNRYTPSDFKIVQRDGIWYAKRGSNKKMFENGLEVQT